MASQTKDVVFHLTDAEAHRYMMWFAVVFAPLLGFISYGMYNLYHFFY